jgi:glutamate-ammonia-ligase adenylyltransferase
MSALHPGFVAARWPSPADPESVTRELERLATEAEALEADPDAKSLLAAMAEPAGIAALAALLGNSPFLTLCLQRDAGFAGRLLRDGPDAALAEIFASLAAAGSEAVTGGDLARTLRVARSAET